MRVSVHILYITRRVLVLVLRVLLGPHRIWHAEAGRLSEHVGVQVGARRAPEALLLRREHASRRAHEALEPPGEYGEHHMRAHDREKLT